jgi:hypothetical protein
VCCEDAKHERVRRIRTAVVECVAFRECTFYREEGDCGVGPLEKQAVVSVETPLVVWLRVECVCPRVCLRGECILCRRATDARDQRQQDVARLTDE